MKMPPTPINKKKVISLILVLVIIVAFFWLFIKYRQAKQQITYLSTPEAQQEIDDLKERVGELINLPEGEPVVATIQDVEALAEQYPFFLGAQNGDKILIFQDKAIIYSPTNDKLVNVGPVYTNDVQSSQD